MVELFKRSRQSKPRSPSRTDTRPASKRIQGNHVNNTANKTKPKRGSSHSDVSIRSSTNEPGENNIRSDEDGCAPGVLEKATGPLSPTAPPLGHSPSSQPPTLESKTAGLGMHSVTSFFKTCKDILLSSWINVLLVFVPVGIGLQAAGVNKNIVFATNAIAIIPLAGLLSYATESVASDLGDTIGALLNVTFGNAVELIIFIALTKNEIRIVQASLLGSILANLLLILGMCFLVGGLKFREQVYNSNVTQMSACLLSLSVMSLLLPTAFHASFNQPATADQAVLHVSRGTSVILLLVYVLYLLFQLKSHAYMYQSTPQHVIDEESHPGVFADILNSSNSSDASTSSSDSDSDHSSRSNTTAKRIKRVLKRGRKRRKPSVGSNDATSQRSTIRTQSTSTASPGQDEDGSHSQIGDTANRRKKNANKRQRKGLRPQSSRAAGTRTASVSFRDFQAEVGGTVNEISQQSQPDDVLVTSESQHDTPNCDEPPPSGLSGGSVVYPIAGSGAAELANQTTHDQSPRRPFNIRGKSVLDALPIIPTMPKVLSNTVFSASHSGAAVAGPMAVTGVTPRALHRSNSLPSRLNQSARQVQPLLAPHLQPHNVETTSSDALDTESAKLGKRRLSRSAAVLLLLFSTGLVAICAEFLVSSIDYLVQNTTVSEAFVGLIILPIVGNAAEHVTAVTVASKNKVDLAIGVAVGSSIQIALFVTPVIVLLGWILAKDMSLYFSLFETISLFVSAFIVNFLIADGRSNYLEGALLIAAYTIIAVAAFFYPDEDEQSFGGAS